MFLSKNLSRPYDFLKSTIFLLLFWIFFFWEREIILKKIHFRKDESMLRSDLHDWIWIADAYRGRARLERDVGIFGKYMHYAVYERAPDCIIITLKFRFRNIRCTDIFIFASYRELATLKRGISKRTIKLSSTYFSGKRGRGSLHRATIYTHIYMYIAFRT